MKSVILILLIISIAFISSCENTNEPAIKNYEHKLNFGKIKANQLDSVIMPLRVGKEWIYEVTLYDKLDAYGQPAVYYDTIKVLSEEQGLGGNWFLVDYLEFEPEPVLMTNTDKGLWMKRQWRNETLKLVAEYPLVSDFYYAGNLGLIGPKDWDPSSNGYENGKMKNCNLYTTTYTFKTAFVKGRVYAGNMYSCDIRSEIGEMLNDKFSESYFSPILGLVKESRHRNNVEYFLVDWK